MPPPYGTNEPSHPMLQLTRSVGAIEKGIQTLEDKQGEIADGQKDVEAKVSALHQWVAGLVTQDECYNRRTEIETVVKGGTFPEVPKIKRPAKKGVVARVAGHAGDITKIFGLLTLIGAALWAAHGFMNRLESAMAQAEQKQQVVNRALLRRLDDPPKPKVVYVPVEPDAGRSRRRTRARRRRRPRKDSR